MRYEGGILIICMNNWIIIKTGLFHAKDLNALSHERHLNSSKFKKTAWSNIKNSGVNSST